MAETPFHRTGYGHEFYGVTMPKIARALAGIDMALTTIAEIQAMPSSKSTGIRLRPEGRTMSDDDALALKRINAAIDQCDGKGYLCASCTLRLVRAELAQKDAIPHATPFGTLELLEALQAIVQVLDGRQPKDVPGALMIARAAILSATTPEP